MTFLLEYTIFLSMTDVVDILLFSCELPRGIVSFINCAETLIQLYFVSTFLLLVFVMIASTFTHTVSLMLWCMTARLKPKTDCYSSEKNEFSCLVRWPWSASQNSISGNTTAFQKTPQHFTKHYSISENDTAFHKTLQHFRKRYSISQNATAFHKTPQHFTKHFSISTYTERVFL